METKAAFGNNRSGAYRAKAQALVKKARVGYECRIQAYVISEQCGGNWWKVSRSNDHCAAFAARCDFAGRLFLPVHCAAVRAFNLISNCMQRAIAGVDDQLFFECLGLVGGLLFLGEKTEHRTEYVKHTTEYVFSSRVSEKKPQ